MLRIARSKRTSHSLDGVRSVPHLSYVHAPASAPWDSLPWRQLVPPPIGLAARSGNSTSTDHQYARTGGSVHDVSAPFVRDVHVAAAFMVGGSPAVAWRWPLWKRPVAYGASAVAGRTMLLPCRSHLLGMVMRLRR